MDDNQNPNNTLLPEDFKDNETEISTYIPGEVKNDTPPSSLKPASHHRTSKLILLVIILLAVLTGVYLLQSNSKPSPKTDQTNKISQPQKLPAVPSSQYTSVNFNLSFNYPKAWTVVDNGSGVLTVTSPTTELESATNTQVNGQITMTIMKQGQLPAAFTSGQAVAVLKSQQINFSQPTSSQASQAYITFVQYAATTTRGGLDALYLTGNYGYAKDQDVPSTDINNVNPLIVISFSKCGTNSCNSNITPLTVASTYWNDVYLKAPILKLLTSMSFN